jgi:hypothetical protein
VILSLQTLHRLASSPHARILVIAVVAALLVALAAWLIVRSRRPSAEELERRRRAHLVRIGRITDGSIVDARTLDGEESHAATPEVLVYSYQFAGVTYNCAQDVSPLPELVSGYRLDQPVQVRYDPRNPGNSIIVAEEWSGIWLDRTR